MVYIVCIIVKWNCSLVKVKLWLSESETMDFNYTKWKWSFQLQLYKVKVKLWLMIVQCENDHWLFFILGNNVRKRVKKAGCLRWFYNIAWKQAQWRTFNSFANSCSLDNRWLLIKYVFHQTFLDYTEIENSSTFFLNAKVVLRIVCPYLKSNSC